MKLIASTGGSDSGTAFLFSGGLGMSDELMARIANGDCEAFVELVEQHRSPLTGFFYRQIRDWQLGEDLSQEVLIRIHETAGDYLPRGLFKAWMYRIARNVLIDYTRKRKHDPLVCSVRSRERPGDDDRDLMECLAGESVDPCESAGTREVVALVMGVMDRLSESSAPVSDQCLALLEWCDGGGYESVAVASGCGERTGQSRVRLAVEKVRERLGV